MMSSRNNLVARFILIIAGAFLIAAPVRGDFLYTGFRNDGITRVDERTGETRSLFATYADGFSDFRGMTVGPDGLLYVSASYTGVNPYGSWGVYRFDPIKGTFLGTFLPNTLMDRIAFGPDGGFYGVDGWQNRLVKYDGSTGVFDRVVLDDDSYYGVDAFAFGSDGDLFAVTAASKLARYSLSTGDRIGPIIDLESLGLKVYRFDEMTFGPTGELYAAYNYQGRDLVLPGGVMRFDPKSGELVETLLDDLPAFGAASGGGLGLAFGPDGELYVGSQYAKAVLRFDAMSRTRTGEFSISGFVQGAEFIQFVGIPEPSAAMIALSALIGAAFRRWPRSREL
jgi:hypothetical protein